MLNMPRCPYCSSPADYEIQNIENEQKIYFCSDCLEHFTIEEKNSLKVQNNLTKSTIIDDVFVRYMNSLKSVEKKC